MRSFRSKPIGWRGNAQGHALAARGIRMYAKKQVLVDPVFYAQKREEKLPFFSILDMVRQGDTYQDMLKKHPDVDAEDVRLRGIKAIEMGEGSDMLSKLNENGVDTSVHMAKASPDMKGRMCDCLDDEQKSSFLHREKVAALKERLSEC